MTISKFNPRLVKTVNVRAKSKSTFTLATRIVERHATDLILISCSRKTGQMIKESFIPARPPSQPNPYQNDLVIEQYSINIDDSIPSGVIEIEYKCINQLEADQIRVKINSIQDKADFSKMYKCR